MITQKMIQDTITHWQFHSKEKLTEEDARDIIENTVALFDLLNELDLEQNKRLGYFVGTD